MNNPKISVIIPVYNVQDYMEDCLNSILNQTMINDLEVIMVDDGSNDDSSYIIEKYAYSHNNFFAYYKENEGPGITRNYGLSKAKGDYVHFMDSDDYIPPDAYEKFYNHAIENDNDFVVSNILRFNESNIWRDILYRNSFRHITQDIPSTHIEKVTDFVWDTSSSNKLFKRDFLIKNNLKFRNKKIFYEDLLFSFKVHCSADSIGVINEDLYFWRLRRNKSSVTQSLVTESSFKDRFEIIELIRQFMDEHTSNQDLVNAQYLKWLNHDFSIYLKRMKTLDNVYQNEIIDFIRNFLKYVPDELLLQLNGYYQLLYYYVGNNDLKRLLKLNDFGSFIENIKSDKLYKKNKNINFNAAFDYEELFAEITDVNLKENNLIINLKSYVQFIPKQDDDEISFKLENLINERDLEFCVNGNIYTLIIPLHLIDESYSKIKVYYKRDNEQTKESYLKYNNRIILENEDMEINVTRSIHRCLVLSSRQKNQNNITVYDVNFEGNDLELKCRCDLPIDSMFIENLIDFEKKSYPVVMENENEFNVTLPYDELGSRPIKKWELKTDNLYNRITVEKYDFFDELNFLRFHNQRNRSVITVESRYRQQSFWTLRKKRLSTEEINNLSNEIYDLIKPVIIADKK